MGLIAGGTASKHANLTDVSTPHATADIADSAITTLKIAANAVTTAKMAASAITNTEVSASAAIAYTKLALATSIVFGDLATGLQTLERVANIELSVAAANIDFTGISANYKGFIALGWGQASAAGSINIAVRFNADAANNYVFERITANAATLSSSASGATSSLYASGMNSAMMSNFVTIIQASATAGNRTFISVGHEEGNIGYVFWGRWASSAAINEIMFLPTTGSNLVAGSRVLLLGWR